MKSTQLSPFYSSSHGTEPWRLGRLAPGRGSKMPRQRGENMGRGGRGGRSPTPNDDRSRSMNPQDPVGQAAMANEARQRGDDDWDDGYDDDVQSGEVTVVESETDYSHWGVYRDEPEKPQEPKPKLCNLDLLFHSTNGIIRAKPKSEDK